MKFSKMFIAMAFATVISGCASVPATKPSVITWDKVEQVAPVGSDIQKTLVLFGDPDRYDRPRKGELGDKIYEYSWVHNRPFVDPKSGICDDSILPSCKRILRIGVDDNGKVAGTYLTGLFYVALDGVFHHIHGGRPMSKEELSTELVPAANDEKADAPTVICKSSK